MQGLDQIINDDNKNVITEFEHLAKQFGNGTDDNLNKHINVQEKSFLISKDKKDVFEKMLDQFRKIQELPEAEKINEVLMNDEGSGEFWDAILQYVKTNDKFRRAIAPALQCTYEEYEKICKDFFENNIKFNGISELEKSMGYDGNAFNKLFRFAEEHIILNRETKDLFQSSMKEQLGLDSARSNILWELFDSNRGWIMQYKTLDYIEALLDAVKDM